MLGGSSLTMAKLDRVSPMGLCIYFTPFTRLAHYIMTRVTLTVKTTELKSRFFFARVSFV